jgi:hypothetical protein
VATPAYYYSNVSVPDTIGNSGGLAATDTSIIAGSLAPEGYPANVPFKLRLEPGTPNEEIVRIASGSGTQLDPWIVGPPGGPAVLGRGWDGTLAAPHSQGAALAHGMTQEDLALARSHESLTNSEPLLLPHGLPLSAWGASATALIQTTILPSNQASVVLSAIPQTYQHLLLVILGKSTDTTGRDDGVNMTFNGDTAARYSTTAGFWTDGTPSGGGSVAASQNSGSAIVVATSASGTANAGGGFAFFPGYSSNTFNKIIVGLSGMGQGTSAANASLRARCVAYNPTSQVGITSIAMSPSGGNFKAGTVFSLYGFG